MHKLEYADNKDMFGIVNSLIKPKTESLPYFVSTEECYNKLYIKIKTLIDQREYANITITESVLHKKTLDGFRTCDINEVPVIPHTKRDKENMCS